MRGVHLVYVTPAGAICTCGWTAQAANARAAESHAYLHLRGQPFDDTHQVINLTHTQKRVPVVPEPEEPKPSQTARVVNLAEWKAGK